MGEISLKILHTNFHHGWGGQSNRILVLSRELASRGHFVAIATPTGSQLSLRARAASIPDFDCVRFARGFHPVSLLKDSYLLRIYIRTLGFHIIHTHGSQDSWAVALATRRLSPRPLIIRTKHNLFPIANNPANAWLYGKVFDHVVCISHEIERYCLTKKYLPREKLSVIHSAVNTDVLESQNVEHVRAEFNLQDKFVVGIIGRLRPEKGHLYLLRAASRLTPKYPDIMFLIVGDGSMAAELKKLADNLQISSRVIFTGFRKDIPRVLRTLDLFVLPSLTEGLGTAIMEAAAVGLPIIATNIGGIPEIVRDAEEALLIPPANEDAIADAITRLYEDRQLASRLAQNARRRILAHFTPARLADQTELLYRSLASHR
jgi:glycosyltransferase involved in cell wall biosynthesis